MQRRVFVLVLLGVVGIAIGQLLLPMAKVGAQFSGSPASFVPDGSNAWVPIGPEGGNVQSLAISSVDPSILVSQTTAGVYYSHDRAAHWTLAADQYAIPDHREIVADPFDGNRFLTFGDNYGGDIDIYESIDGGAHWKTHPTDFGSMRQLLFHPTMRGLLYASANDAIYRSVDGGITWSVRPIPEGNNTISLLLHPTDPTTLYLTRAFQGFYVSHDGGDTWTQQNPDARYVLDVVDSVSGAIYARGSDSATLVKSLDEGVTWLDISNGLPDVEISDVLVDPAAPMTVYVTLGDFSTGESGIFRSTDGGASWSEVNTGLPPYAYPYTLIADTSTTPTTIYAGKGGIYRTTDGSTWTAAQSGMNARALRDIAVDPTDNAHWYTVSGIYLFETVDSGDTWVPTIPFEFLENTNDISLYTVAVAATTPLSLYVGTDDAGVFRSTDDGATWIPVNTGFPDGDESTVVLIRVDPSASDHLLAISQGDIYRSTDGGMGWEQVYRDLYVTMVRFSPTVPGEVWATNDFGLLHSTDSGATWTQIEKTGLPQQPRLSAIALHPTNSNILFAGGFSEGILYRSVDGGATWESLDVGLSGFYQVMDIAIAPDDPSLVFATIHGININGGDVEYPHGVYLSRDGGDTWTLYDEGLTYRVATRMIALEGRVVTITNGGSAYRLDTRLTPPVTPMPTSTVTPSPVPTTTPTLPTPSSRFFLPLIQSGL